MGAAQPAAAAPSQARRVLGMMSSFVASGLIHEAMLWYAQHVMDGRWLALFAIQARAAPSVLRP